ncbi:MAG: sodium-dependent transporter [Dehalococcoidia bacterium]|nr:sodium-dependent transporter [Dehalococcoidia bacterium]
MTDSNGRAGPAVFSGRLSFILAAAGAAVGLGNIWRFPFVAGENGGGAFLLPYLLAVVLLAGPAMLLEIAAGRSTRKGVVGTFTQAARFGRWPGVLIAVTALGLVSYYLVVTGWALGYLAHAVAGSHPSFGDFTSGNNSLWYFGLAAGVSASVVVLGVNRGIETMSRVLVPALFMMLLFLAIYALSLASRDEALRFYLSPDFGELSRPIVWVRAAGQAFFSVGVGMGVLITYGAYASERERLIPSAAAVVAADVVVAILAGLVIFPLAFSYGTDVASGPELAFETLPRAFEGFGAVASYTVAVGFYLALSVAAITSAVSLIETVTAALGDATALSRSRAIGVTIAATVLLGIPSALSYSSVDLRVGDLTFFELMDTAVGTIGLATGALITTVVLGWAGRRRVLTALHGSGFPGAASIWFARWVVPAAITILLFAMLFDLVRHRILPEGG